MISSPENIGAWIAFEFVRSVAGRRMSADQTSAALAILIRKLEILVGGAEKRGNREVVEEYGPRLIHWASRQTKG